MMRFRLGFAAAFACVVVTSHRASADVFDLFEPNPRKGSIGRDVCPETPADFEALEHDKALWSATRSGYLNGIGTPCRYWELRSTTAFDTNRTLTQRFELARALTWRQYLTVIVRTSFGFDALVDDSFYGIQGPIFSLGVRDRTPSANYSVEFGLRFIPPWRGPTDDNPLALKLALNASLSSGIGDDAAWLPFTDYGTQLYGAFQARTETMDASWASAYFGAAWGGKASLGSMNVRSWLGPQTGFIGNLFLEGFVGLPHIASSRDVNLQLGVHGEISISSIWPGDALFPSLANLYVAWSPKSFFQLRIFGGPAAPLRLLQDASFHYGTRLEFFFP